MDSKGKYMMIMHLNFLKKMEMEKCSKVLKMKKHK